MKEIGESLDAVAQIFNLLYRRFAICETPGISVALESSRRLPSATRRYGRVQLCATTAS
jgi:hypothetical protein